MIRFIASVVLKLLGNALGLIIASLVLGGFKISGVAFITAVLIFTVVEVLADPLLDRVAQNSLPALRGGVALMSTFIGLLVTNIVSTGLTISGLSTWLLATIIVWLCTLLAAVILPLFMFKKIHDNCKNSNA